MISSFLYHIVTNKTLLDNKIMVREAPNQNGDLVNGMVNTTFV